MARTTWRRIQERWFSSDQRYVGRLRDTIDGYEVIDGYGNLIAGPNPDVDLVLAMADSLGVYVPTDPDVR